MPVVVVGVHERDVPLDVLERVTVSPRDLGKALRSLCDSPHLSEAVVLSTCLRTEVYAVLERFHDGVADIEGFFEARAGSGWTTGVAAPGTAAAPLSSPESSRASGARGAGSPAPPAPPEPSAGGEGGLYCAFDDAAASHLFEVAAGIDSAVLGEGEVLRQVRQAHEQARAEQASGPVLDRLFRHAVEVGKRARTETSIARGVTSLSHAAVALAAEELGGSLRGQRVLVVGAGEMAVGMLAALERLDEPPRGVGVAARSRTRAEEAVRRLQHPTADAIGLEDLRGALAGADVLFTCTASSSPLVGAEEVAVAMAGRADRPLLVVDAAVPRDVDPEVAGLEGVTLRDMDDLRAFAESQMAGRAAEVGRVRELVTAALERYRAESAARGAVPVIAALRSRADTVRASELERHRGKLRELDDEQRAAVEALTRGIVAKLLHEPTVRLKDAAGSPRGERLGESLRDLFDL